MHYTMCNTCGKKLSNDNFYMMRSKYFSKKEQNEKIYTYIRTPCKKCVYNQAKNWVKNNKKQSMKTQRLWNYNMKIKLLRELGGKCICCGNSEFWNLTLDHIIPILRKNNERLSLYSSLSKNIEERKKFQLLCYGCNNSKNKHIYCSIDHNLKI